MDEVTNEDRAGWAETAVEAFAGETGQIRDVRAGRWDEDLAREVVGDLLGDLMHWCDRVDGVSFEDLVEAGRYHYEHERPCPVCGEEPDELDGLCVNEECSQFGVATRDPVEEHVPGCDGPMQCTCFRLDWELLRSVFKGHAHDPEAVENLTGDHRWVMVENNRHDGSYWLTTWADQKAAAEYRDGQEYPEDWPSVSLIDRRTGQVYRAESVTQWELSHEWPEWIGGRL